MEIVSAQSELELNLPTTNFVGLACTCSMYRLGNRKVGPFLTPPFENFTGSPLGAIPKKHSAPVKWRIIHDLSWPTGLSVNDGIPRICLHALAIRSTAQSHHSSNLELVL